MPVGWRTVLCERVQEDEEHGLVVLLYTAASWSGVIHLQRDLDSSIIKPTTAVLQLVTYPILWSLGWTKAWATVYASPSTKFRLNQVCQRTGKTGLLSNGKDRIFNLSPKPFNILVISGYIASFGITIPIAAMVGYHTSRINVAWESFETSSRVLLDPLSSPQSRLLKQGLAMHTLSILEESSQRLLTLIRVLGGLFGFLDSFAVMVIFVASQRIISALWSQVGYFRESYHRRRAIKLETLHPTKSYSGSNIYGLTQSTALGSTDYVDDSGSSVKTDSGRLFSEDRWLRWLPSLSRGTEVDANTWGLQLFHQPRQDWEAIDEILLIRQYLTLRKYTSNTLWQAILACSIGLSYIILSGITVFNTMKVPEKTSLTSFTIFVSTWTNITWNLGIGIGLGALSCAVAFSPTPAMPGEPRERSFESGDPA